MTGSGSGTTRHVSEERMRELLLPYWGEPVAPELAGKLAVYLDLLLRWNARLNLSAIRDAEEMIRRHFGESLFCARHLPEQGGLLDTPLETLPGTLLDVGTGAGFPGMVIALARPALRVTLAESQGKKVSFLREVARTLSLEVEVWGRRLEEMPADRRFGVVTLRAVDRPEQALALARERVAAGGLLAHLRGGTAEAEAGEEQWLLPGSGDRYLAIKRMP